MQNGTKQEEFLCFATEAYNRADLRPQDIDGFTASTKNHVVQEFVSKEEITEDDGISGMQCVLNENWSLGTYESWVGNGNAKLKIPPPEKSISSTDSQGLQDY